LALEEPGLLPTVKVVVAATLFSQPSLLLVVAVVVFSLMTLQASVVALAAVRPMVLPVVTPTLAEPVRRDKVSEAVINRLQTQQ